MEADNSTFKIPFTIPSPAPSYAHIAPTPPDTIYQELAAISEEIQKCRSDALSH